MSQARERSTRITVVVLTHNRSTEVVGTLARLVALRDRPRIVVVDNASEDDTAPRIAAFAPEVEVVRSPCNLGAAGRNLGVARVSTDYVAFCDDDTWWDDGTLTRAVELLDAHPHVAVLSARVVVGDDCREDATCAQMAASPLPSEGLPGPALVGYMAGACVMRTTAFRAVGGYDARLFIGGEEEPVALDLLSAGWVIVYAPELTLHHHPSRQRDSALRERLIARNRAWTAWTRLSFSEALARTAHALGTLVAHRAPAREWRVFAHGLVGAWRRRNVVPPGVRQWRRLVRQAARTSDAS